MRNGGAPTSAISCMKSSREMWQKPEPKSTVGASPISALSPVQDSGVRGPYLPGSEAFRLRQDHEIGDAPPLPLLPL